jgi:hypothetical protein
MKRVVIGAHLRREDIEPLAAPIAAGGVFLSAMLVADDQPLSDRDLLVRVSKVRAALLDQATFVAVRYGFSALTDEEVAAKCAALTYRWRDLLERYRDHVELTLKVGVASPEKRPDRHDFKSGAAYLKALHAAREAANVDDGFRVVAEKMFAPAAKRRWLHRDESSIELAALLPRVAVDECFTAAAGLKEQFPHVPFLLSGPWPLEVFADADDQ